MDRPLGAEEGVEVRRRQEVIRTVGTHRHAQHVTRVQAGHTRAPARVGTIGVRSRPGREARPRPASARPFIPPMPPSVNVAAEPMTSGTSSPASEEQVGPHPRRDVTDRQYIAPVDRERPPGLRALRALRPLEAEFDRARDQDPRRTVKGERRTADGDFQAGRTLGIAEQPVAEPEREVVHGAGRRHADVPVPHASGPGLYRGLRARRQHFDGTRPIVEGAEGRRVVARRRERVATEGLVQVGAVRLDAVHDALAERGAQPAARLFPGSGVRHDLGQQRVVERRHLGAGTQPRVRAQARPVREGDDGQPARRRPEAVVRVLRAEARLDRAAGRREVRGQGVEGRQLAGGQFEHPADEVDAVHEFRDPVLHLQPRVDLEERRLLPARVVEELHGAGAAVGDAREQRPRVFVHAPPHGLGQVRRRALLDDFLVPPLQGAVPVPQDRDAAFPIAEGLHLHVPRCGHAALDEQPRVAERAAGEPFHGGEPLREFVRVLAALHADPATAGGTLQHHRVADRRRLPEGVLDVREHAAARQEGDAGVRREPPRLVLEAEAGEVFRPGAHERDAALRERPGEGRVLAQETVPGVHRLRAGAVHGVEQLADVEVGLGHAAVAERMRLPGRFHVQGAAVGVGVHRCARDAHGVERAADAHGDLAAVRDLANISVVSCSAVSASHGACAAGNGGPIAKGRNTATGPVGRALREIALAALWSLPICPIFPADQH